MEPVILLKRAHSAGLTVTPDGDRLIVRGPRRAAGIVEELRSRKAELLALLRPPDPWEALIDRLNAACPPSCSLTPEDWAALDALESPIQAARAADHQRLQEAIRAYEQTAMAFFAERTATPAGVAEICRTAVPDQKDAPKAVPTCGNME